MTKRATVRTLWVSLAVSAAMAAVAAATWRHLSPDHVLARGYGSVLGDIDTSWGSRHAGNVWLSEAAAGDAASVLADSLITGPVTIGDRITIAARNGGRQAIEVVAIEEIDGGAFGLAGMRFHLVTGRPDTGHTALVRFLFALDIPAGKLTKPPAGRSL